MYCTQTDIEAYLQQRAIAQLTDDGDGNENVLSQVMTAASSVVDSYLAAVVSTPMESPPAWIAQAAAIITCELLYARRQIPAENNPFIGLADIQRKRLASIAAGNENFMSDGTPGAAVISEPAKTYIENAFMI